MEEALQPAVAGQVPGQAEGLGGAADVDPLARLALAVELGQGGDVEELDGLAAEPVAVGRREAEARLGHVAVQRVDPAAQHPVQAHRRQQPAGSVARREPALAAD